MQAWAKLLIKNTFHFHQSIFNWRKEFYISYCSEEKCVASVNWKKGNSCLAGLVSLFFFSSAKMSYSVITNSNITKQTVALALISIKLKVPCKNSSIALWLAFECYQTSDLHIFSSLAFYIFQPKACFFNKFLTRRFLCNMIDDSLLPRAF